MSSRARRVDQPVQPFNWAGSPQLVRDPAPCIGVAESAVAHQGQVADPIDADTAAARHDVRADEIERDAFAKGYAQGERAGMEAAGHRADAMLRRLTGTIEELSALRGHVIRGTERQVVQLAMAVARRVLQRELAADRGLLIAMARVALDRLGEYSPATIRLHPEDHAVVMAARQDGVSSNQVDIVADPVVGRGGCLVQSDFGLMEVGLDAQFNELARQLLGEREADPEPSLEAAYEFQTVGARI